MTTRTSPNFAQRTGQSLGRVWRWARGQQYRFIRWATVKGVPNTLVKFFVIIINLIFVAALLYIAFWITLMVGLIMVLLMNTTRPSSENENIYEWELRTGNQGFGVYSKDGHQLIGDDDDA
jgi:hypothetical protein